MLVPEDRRFFDADLEQPAAELPGGPRAVPRRAARPGRPSPSSTGSSPPPTRTGSWTWPPPRSRCPPDPVDRAWYTELEARLRRRGRHRRRDHDPHQPPHPSGARHRRPLRLHAGPRDRDDRRDPGPAAAGTARTCCCARPRSARWRSHAPSGTPTGTLSDGHAAGPVRRGRGARRRAHPGGPRPLRRAGRRGGPSAGRRPGRCVAPTWHRGVEPGTARPPSATLWLRRSRLLQLRVDDERRRRTYDAGAAAALDTGRSTRSSRRRRPAPRADRLRGLPAPFGCRHLRLEPHRRRDRPGTPTRVAPSVTRLDGGRRGSGGRCARGGLRRRVGRLPARSRAALR